MENKKYSSYAQIDRELEILKIEKEISLQKMIVSFHETRDNLTPQKLLSGFLSSYVSSYKDTIGSVLKIAVPFVVKWFMNKKRGR